MQGLDLHVYITCLVQILGCAAGRDLLLWSTFGAIGLLCRPGGERCLQQRDSYFIAEQAAPAPHRAHPEGCAALRIVLVTVPRVSRSCEYFPDGFDLHLPLLPRTCVSSSELSGILGGKLGV